MQVVDLREVVPEPAVIGLITETVARELAYARTGTGSPVPVRSLRSRTWVSPTARIRHRTRPHLLVDLHSRGRTEQGHDVALDQGPEERRVAYVLNLDGRRR
jgi:hypothetical protein